jgi:rhodanese-related sulfurtransferase
MKQPIVINVLDTKHYQDCHIPTSLNIPLDQLETYATAHFKKDDCLIVYCAHYECSASKNAFKLLTQQGFSNVYAYEGGIVEWKQKEYPLVGNCILFEKYFKNPPKPPQNPDQTIKTISAEELKSIMQKYNML